MFTRGRDLVAVVLVAAVVGFLLVLAGYSSLPPLPRLAGLVPALLGVGEAVVGHGFRARIQDSADRRPDGTPIGAPGPSRRPVPPLTAARALMAAKATSLAGSALLGLWVGLLAYVWPRSAQVLAAAADTPSALIGVAGALVMVGGGLYLEHCLRAPDAGRSGR
ncbi:DUF3180 domain-containing protein [Nakamurella flavida]|uniref:DUF3180 domain-containing protein n=1 Tax=Nakamurella flavida TaxID=363630 RepID=A0A939C502_9ACTN|nr:DUF3180 domain-containing protein [Nakamurella flavida]MBM9475727.1 DUF3180 domain-containing protein [Nakamurella flavida]MDP9777994.1 hypothetical protein [Nakamurella flavida]